MQTLPRQFSGNRQSPRAAWIRAALFAATALLPAIASAFTFVDGTTSACVAGSETIPEYSPPPGSEAVPYTGQTVKVGASYQIVWNKQKLDALPREVHDFLFFHECAHAQIPTKDEVRANCVGLKNMRAAGRAGFAVEAKLAAFYGATNDYWKNTLSCANADGGASVSGNAGDASKDLPKPR